MFKALLKQIKNLFDGEFPDLDEAEKKCMSAKNSPFLREKITFLPGGRFGKGQIVMTKTIDRDFQNFFRDFFYGLRIPGIFSIDAHGFVQNSDGFENCFPIGLLISGESMQKVCSFSDFLSALQYLVHVHVVPNYH